MRGLGRRDAWLALLPLCALILLHAPVLFGGRVYFTNDLTHISQPWRTLTAEALQKGVLPLWNPYAFFGLPLLGNMQTGALAPLSTVFHVFPFTRALGPFLLLQYALAVFWTWLFLRARGLRRPSAFAGAALFAFGGYLTAYLQFPNLLATLVHLPAFLLFAGRPLPLALVSANAFLSGYPPVWAGLAACLLSGAAAWPRRDGEGTREALRSGLGLALGLSLSAAVLLPGLELARGSARAGGTDPQERVNQSLKPYELSLFIQPALTRALARRIEEGAPQVSEVTWEERGVPHRFSFRYDRRETLRDPAGVRVKPWKSLYVGFAAFLLALVGWAVLSRERPVRGALFAAGIAAVALLTLGDRSGLSRWLWDNLAPLQLLRGPARLGYLALAGLVPLAALGVDLFARRSAAGAGALSLLVLGELCALAWGFYPTLSADYYLRPGPLVERLRSELDEGRFRYYQTTTGEVWALVDQDDPSPAYRRFREENLRAYRHKLFGLAGAPYHLEAAGGEYEPLVPAQTYAVARALKTSPPDELEGRLRLSGVGIYLDRREDPQSPLRALGRAFWSVYGPRGEASRARLLAQEQSRSLERPFVEAARALSARGFSDEDARSCVRPREDRIVCEGGNREKGTLFIAEPSYPGWRAFVDGGETPLERAAGAFLSVELPAGSRRVELRYEPLSWGWGVALTLLTLCGSLGALWLRLQASRS